MTRIAAAALSLAIGALLCACARHAVVELWTPPGAQIEPLPPSHSGIVEKLFWMTGTPSEISAAVRRHYAQTDWHEETSPHVFEWNAWSGGGVLTTPGQKNAITLYWYGVWHNDAGGTLKYHLTAETNNATNANVRLRAYATYVERDPQ